MPRPKRIVYTEAEWIKYLSQAEQFLQRVGEIALNEYGVFIRIRFDWTDNWPLMPRNERGLIFLDINMSPEVGRTWIEYDEPPLQSIFDPIEPVVSYELKTRMVYPHTFGMPKLAYRTVCNLTSAGHMALFIVRHYNRVKYKERIE